MGGRTEVDLTQLRTVADHVMQAADAIAEMRWPGLDPDDLQGSAVGRPRHLIWSPHGSPKSLPTCGGGPWRRTCRPTPLSAPTTATASASRAVTRPTVSQAEAWQPDSLRRLADAWDEAARRLAAHVDSAMREIHRSNEFWTGATADAARDNARGIAAAGDDAARRLVLASVAARDGADQIAAARTTRADAGRRSPRRRIRRRRRRDSVDSRRSPAAARRAVRWRPCRRARPADDAGRRR